MDNELRLDIIATVRAAMQQVAEENDERWLSADELTEQFGFFSASWLRRYGHTLPRTQVIVTESDGKSHKTAFCYPRNRIQRMIMSNQIKNLKA